MRGVTQASSAARQSESMISVSVCVLRISPLTGHDEHRPSHALRRHTAQHAADRGEVIPARIFRDKGKLIGCRDRECESVCRMA
jgi:hypothetical protein